MPFHVYKGTILFAYLISVYSERIDIAKLLDLLVRIVIALARKVSYRSWNTSRAEQMHESMYSLLIVDMVVPEHSCVRDISTWVFLVTAVQAGKLYWISYKEDGQVVHHKILITFLGEEFHRPSSYITESVAGSLLATDSGNAEQAGCLLAESDHKFGVGDV